MNPEEQDKQAIREFLDAWLRASAEGDLETILSMMDPDVVFLRPGQPVMRGRQAFAEASRAMQGQVRIEGRPDIQEIHLAGGFAFVWNYLTITATPRDGGEPKSMAGNILTLFRREADGRWVIFRDANLLAPVKS